MTGIPAAIFNVAAIGNPLDADDIMKIANVVEILPNYQIHGINEAIGQLERLLNNDPDIFKYQLYAEVRRVPVGTVAELIKNCQIAILKIANRES